MIGPVTAVLTGAAAVCAVAALVGTIRVERTRGPGHWPGWTPPVLCLGFALGAMAMAAGAASPR